MSTDRCDVAVESHVEFEIEICPEKKKNYIHSVDKVYIIGTCLYLYHKTDSNG